MARPDTSTNARARAADPNETLVAAPAASAIALSNAEIAHLMGRSTGQFERSAHLPLFGAKGAPPAFRRREYAALPGDLGPKDALSSAGEGARPVGDISEPASVDTVDDTTEGADGAARAPHGAGPSFHADGPPPPLDIEAEKRAAHAEGRAEALEEIEAAKEAARQDALQIAQQEADRSVSEARDVFLAAAARLDAAANDAEMRLARTIEASVHALASDRAGVEIDRSPPAFIARIERVARTVASECQGALVEMHPEDLAAIEPYLSELTTLSGAQLTSGQGLARGDLKLQLGDIAFEDVLDRPVHEAEE
ncbi:MAG: hypothetical protein AAGA15_00425 [Pseudomonadota bacterium]